MLNIIISALYLLIQVKTVYLIFCNSISNYSSEVRYQTQDISTLHNKKGWQNQP